MERGRRGRAAKRNAGQARRGEGRDGWVWKHEAATKCERVSRKARKVAREGKERRRCEELRLREPRKGLSVLRLR